MTLMVMMASLIMGVVTVNDGKYLSELRMAEDTVFIPVFKHGRDLDSFQLWARPKR